MATTATPSRVVSYSAPSSPLSSLSATPSISSSSPAPSMLSRSPSLPPQLYSATVPTTNCTDTKAMDASCRYPSPTSTAPLSGSASPLKPQNAVDIGEIQVCGSGQPPAKRRKIAERKPRTTEYIDLDSRDEAADAQLDRLLHVLRRKKKIVVIAGAGISVSAGIPDFRSSQGLFKTLADKHKIKGGGKALFDASVYKDGKSTAEFHKMVRDLSGLMKEAKPTSFHHMLASIANDGRLMRLYTQNVDCLDTSLQPLATKIPLNNKGPWPVTIQLHGGLEKMQCTKCNHVANFDGSLFQGPEPPSCKDCEHHDLVRTQFAGKRSHGIGRLRPRMVLYNEYNPDEDAIGRVSQADLRRVPDAVIVVGTSLKVPGVRRIVRELCQATRSKRDGFTAWINLDPVPQGPDMKDLWDLVVRGKSDDVASLLGLPKWDCEDIGPDKEDYMVSGSVEREEKYEQLSSRAKINVLLESKKRSTDAFSDAESRSGDHPEAKSKIVDKVQEAALPTPSASPRNGSPLPRKPLPKGRTKQSTLSFVGQGAGATKNDRTGKATKKRAGRPKKENTPKNDIAKTFKATKGVSETGKVAKAPLQQIKNEVTRSGPKMLDLETATCSLPSLRPTSKDVDNLVHCQAGAPTSDSGSELACSEPDITAPKSSLPNTAEGADASI